MQTIVIEPKEKAKACVIWMHGLGASANDMAGLAEQLPFKTPIRHVALNAPVRPVTVNQGMVMPAWYDITGLTLTDREDEAGIMASEQQILNAIQTEIDAGFKPSEIYLAGFSQGGAMALFTALRSSLALGGILALSAYLPLASKCQAVLNTKTPIFMASGRDDQVVLPAWTKKTVEWLKGAAFHALTVREYPMGHAVCMEEMRDISIWLDTQVGETS